MLYDKEEPEWNEENKNRKHGETTFDICGWCKYTSIGAWRYNCAIDSRCELMRTYDNVKWNTKCIFKRLSKSDLNSIIDSKKFEIQQSYNKVKELNDEIGIIESEMSKHNNSPPLPSNRTEDYNENESVYVNINKKWEHGTVVEGYRSHDGYVSYALDNYPESKEGWGCGVGVPQILKEWEYNYFKNNPEDYKVWKEMVESVKYNGESIILGMI